jgi:beta-lactam-binding protein with PASTA domain/6-phosphogluconolactonase (cycloisomerase 2 family)
MELHKMLRCLLVALCASVVLAACGGGGSSGGNTNVSVPNVVGMSQANASSSITGAGLTVGTTSQASSSSVAAGNIISQSPAAGSSVASGSAVNLTVSTGPAQAQVPNVVGMSQANASSSITGAGLTVGSVSMQASNTVAKGNVISQSPAAGTSVANGSAVNLTVSSGPGTIAVPDVVGKSELDATTAITTAGLVVGTVTQASSASVAKGNVISSAPVAGTQVAPGSKVDLTVSSGAGAQYAYVSNNALDASSNGVLSGYTVGADGGLTALAPTLVPGITGFGEIKIDPSKKFVYVVNSGTDTTVGSGVYGFVIGADGSLTATPNSPYATDHLPVSLTFDTSGNHLYVSNLNSKSISAFTLNTATGELTELADSPYAITAPGTNPAQIVASKNNFLYVTMSGVSTIEVFSINPSTGALTEGVTGSPFGTDQHPFAVAINPAGTILYTVALPSGGSTRYISAFTVNADGTLVGNANNPQLASPQARNYIAFDPTGKFLLVTEAAGIDVYQYDQSTGDTGAAVTGSPFAAGTNPVSMAIDAAGHVYVGNDGSNNVSQYALSGTTGALSAITGSPVAAGTNPDYIAVQ